MKKKTKFLTDKLEAELLFQSELTKSKIEIKEQTLTNVSRELHDNIGQILSVALMQMNILIENNNNYTISELTKIKDLVTKSLNEIRLLSKIMNGDVFLNTNFEYTSFKKQNGQHSHQERNCKTQLQRPPQLRLMDWSRRRSRFETDEPSLDFSCFENRFQKGSSGQSCQHGSDLFDQRHGRSAQNDGGQAPGSGSQTWGSASAQEGNLLSERGKRSSDGRHHDADQSQLPSARGSASDG